MDELKADVKAIKVKLDEVAGTLIRNTVSLEIHEKRTDLAEQRLGKLEQWLLTFLSGILLTLVGLVLKSFFL